MLKKLRIKFIIYTMCVVLVMLTVIFALVYQSTHSRLMMESRQLVQQLLSDPVLPEQSEEQSERISGASSLNLPYFVVELNLHRDISRFSGSYDELDAGLAAEVTQLVFEQGGYEGFIEQYNLRFARSSSPIGQKIVFVDTSFEDASMHSLRLSCLLIGFASIIVFFLISLLLAHAVTKPVEKAWEQQKQFVADASHELKTPLTVIMTNAELLQGDKCSREEQLSFSGNILVMSRQMRSLVENMLELARVDSHASTADFEIFDLSELISDGLLPFEPLFFEAGLNLCSETQPEIKVNGSRRQLSQVLDILLDNSMKYSLPGGDINVSLSRSGGHCLLSVDSPGAPLSRREAQDIFKRFYRRDSSRSTNGSYGLGLPIAHGIVSAHRGRIWAQSHDGRNVFYVQLPLA